MHQALYRSYRPQSFQEVLGQDHIVPILENQIKTGNVSHAYLFTGPRGTGKTSTAKIFAAALNQGSTMDIIELDAASHNGVENMRDILDKIALAPFEGKYKIYIFDEAHMFSTSAANALLKTLEEPPEHVVFILATTEPHRLPATVLSRTQRFDFNKITKEVILQRMETILQQEKIPYDAQALDLIARKSDGGLRDALTLLDKAIAYGPLNEENIAFALGSAQSQTQLQIIEAIVNQDGAKALQVFLEIQSAGLDPKVFFLDMVGLLQDVIMVSNQLPYQQEAAKQCAHILSDKEAAYLIEEISLTLNELRFSDNPGSITTAKIIQLAGTNLKAIDSLRQLPQIVKKELAYQQFEIQSLRQEIADLKKNWVQGGSYPQKSGDNPSNNVDNHKISTNDRDSRDLELSTSAVAEIPHVGISDLSQREMSEEEKQTLDKVTSINPQLHAELKAIRRVQTYVVLMMAEPFRYIQGNLFYLFKGEHKNMIRQMQITDPSSHLDDILSKLLDQKVKTHFMTEDDLPNFREDQWQVLADTLESTFPNAKIRIEG